MNLVQLTKKRNRPSLGFGKLAPPSPRQQDRQRNREGKHMRRIAILVIGFALLAAPALAQSKAAIQKLEDQWGAAFNKGDAAAVAAMYSEDAHVLPAGDAMVKGRAAIEALWKKDIAALGDVKCTTLDVKPLGRSGAGE